MRADLSYQTYPVIVIDRQTRVLRNKEVNLVKYSATDKGQKNALGKQSRQ